MQPGTRNYMGVKSPAVDAMIAALLEAESREEFVSAVRALDRVLISGFYVVPLFHLPDAVDRALDHDRAAGGDFALRLPSRNLVAPTEQPMRLPAVILDGQSGRPAAPHIGTRVTLDGLVAAGGAAARDRRLDDSRC